MEAKLKTVETARTQIVVVSWGTFRKFGELLDTIILIFQMAELKLETFNSLKVI